ncbi:MAG TPA: VanZ family protein [Burkholderiales bacterium]|nr:VanZ family protein [Burkholderiales bacterium]
MSFSALAARYARIKPSKLHVALPLLVMAVLYRLSSVPVTPVHEDPALYGVFYWMPSWLQNTLHVPAYAVLAWTTWWALGAWLPTPSARAIRACAIASAYGIFDEWHQSFVPGRHASLIDLVLDFAGVAVGIWLAVWIGSRAATITSQKATERINPKA